jgi:adhesin transport system membrane fusion protein
VIEGRVRPNDIAFLRTGQSALVKITAYNFAAYGGLRGTVIDISPDALESPEHPGETFYRVRIRTDRCFLERGTTKLAIAPGMTAEAAIKIGEKSLLAYILKPITRRPPTAAWQEATPPIGKGS